MIGSIKHDHFTDHEKIAREAEEMANDPDIQRVLRGEDLPLDELYCPSEANEKRMLRDLSCEWVDRNETR